MIVLLVFVGFAQPISAANSGDKTGEIQEKKRTNYNWIVEKEDYLEYTYEEDGEVFKVEEEINKGELNEVVSGTMYKQNSEGKFELYSTHEYNLSKETGVVDIQISEPSGKLDTWTVETGKMVSEADISSDVKPMDHDDSWQFVGTFYYSDYINNLTVAGIIIVIGATLNFWGSTVLAAIAAAAHSLQAETLYHTVKEWGKYHPGTLIPAGKEQHLWSYTDRYRTNLVPDGTNWPKGRIQIY